MFRIIKLALFAVAGYALYEFYLGLTAEPQPTPTRSTARKSKPAMSGRVEGMSQKTEDSNGASAKRKVGRGVVVS